MLLEKYISIFLLATVKFMFTPFLGPAEDLSFLETYILCVSGGIASASFFYFLSDYFMQRSKEKQFKKIQEQLDKGEKIKFKKRFTRKNRVIVKTKMTIGQVGLSLWAPFFLSVPIGSIIVAKFFRKKRGTYILICTGMLFNAFLMTSLAYFVFE